MIFSHRYRQALKSGILKVELDAEVRSKLHVWVKRYNGDVHIQRDPNSSWTDNSSVLYEVVNDLKDDYGWAAVPGTFADAYVDEQLRAIMETLEGYRVLDVVEAVWGWQHGEAAEQYRKKINEIMELHEAPWRLQDGEFFKLDQDFVGARLAVDGHDALVKQQFGGAADEYSQARQDQTSGDIKDAIFYACKSYESVLKVLTGEPHINADKLSQKFLDMGFLDDLPEEVRKGFAGQVMMCVPFLRNKLGGHGQGAEVVSVPPVYGELAIQLAAAMHNFLVAKHLERKPPPPEPEKVKDKELEDDEIPF